VFQGAERGGAGSVPDAPVQPPGWQDRGSRPHPGLPAVGAQPRSALAAHLGLDTGRLGLTLGGKMIK